MSYVDLNTIHNPSPGGVAPSAWGDQIRDNFEFLIDPPVCSVAGSGTQNVEHDDPTVLNAPTENFDNDGMHSTVSNTSRITAQTPGRYLFMATVRFDDNSNAGVRRVSLRVNGTTLIGGMQVHFVSTNGNPVRIQATRALVLSAGDYVEPVAYQNSGVDILTVHLDEFLAMFLTRS